MGSGFVVNMRFALYLLRLIFLRIYTYTIYLHENLDVLF